MNTRKALILDILLLTALIVLGAVTICALTFTRGSDITLIGDGETTAVPNDLFPGSSIQKEYALKLPGRVTFSATFEGEGRLAEYIETRVEFDGEEQFDGRLSELIGRPLCKAAENAVTVRVTYTLPSSTPNEAQNTDLDVTLTFSQR